MNFRNYFTLLVFSLLINLATKAQQVDLTVDVPEQAYFCKPQTITIQVASAVSSGILKMKFNNGETIVNSTCTFTTDPTYPNEYFIYLADIADPNECTFEITIPCKLNSTAGGAFVNDIEFQSGTGSLTSISTISWTLTTSLITQAFNISGNITTSASIANVVQAGINVYYLNLRKSTVINSNVGVNYFDSYNSSNPGTANDKTRTIRYENTGPNASDPLDILVFLTFSDAYSCLTNDVLIKSFNIQHMRNGVAVNNFLATNPTPSYQFTSPEVSFDNFEHDDYIEIIETLTFPNYQDVCMEGSCGPGGTDKLLNSEILYGCAGYLCNRVAASDDIARGPKKPEIKIWRLEPDPIANSIIGTPLGPLSPYHGVWQYGLENQSVQRWKFLIQNTGDDVAKNATLSIKDINHSNFYYVKDNFITGAFRFTPSYMANYVSLTPRTVSPASCISCTSAIQEGRIILGTPLPSSTSLNPRCVLAPGESVEVEFEIFYEVPSLDEGLFEVNKVLNDWAINVEYKEECTNQSYFSLGGEYIDQPSPDPDLYEIDPYSSSISPNLLNGTNPSVIFLKQDFTTNVSSLSAAQPSPPFNQRSWGPYSNLEAHNFDFCSLNMLNDFRGANLISSKIDFTSSGSMILEGGIRFMVDADQLLDAANIRLSYLDNTNTLQNWPTTGTNGSYFCGQSNQYYADFLFSDCPSGQTLDVIYDILSNSNFTFDLRAACEPIGCTTPASLSKNPKYRLKTFLLVWDLPNNALLPIPLTLKDGEIAINCPGCQLPGITVHPNSDVLDRTTFGLEDADDDGLADLNAGNTTQITSATYSSRFNDLEISHSILGDELKIVAKATINDGSEQSFSTLHTRPVYTDPTPLPSGYCDDALDLEYYYGELSIENSSTDRFDVEPQDLKIEILNQAVPATIYITPADVAWSDFVYDKRNEPYSSTDKLNIILIDLSAALINSKLGTAYFPGDRFSGSAEFTVTMNFKQKNNYTKTYGSFTASDNRSRSKVALNFYLTGQPLVGSSTSSPMYDAFTHGRITIAQEVYGLNSTPANIQFSVCDDMLYFCETYSEYHYFYSIAAEIYASILDERLIPLTNIYTKCNKAVHFKNTFSIGGELTNVFPFEFRKIPSLKNIIVQLPGSIGTYQFSPIDYNFSSSGIKLPRNSVCQTPSIHSSNLVSNTQPPYFPAMDLWLPSTSGISTTITNFPETVADENISISACNSALNNSSKIIYGDEYFNENLVYPFELYTCDPLMQPIGPLQLSFASLQLEVSPGVLQNFIPNNTYSPLLTITTNQNSILMSTTTPTISGGSRNVTMPIEITLGINDDYIQNVFLYFDEPVGSNLFSSVEVVNSTTSVIIPLTKVGDRWYCNIGGMAAGYSNTFTINAEIGNCYTDISFPFDIYIGSTCEPVTTSLPSTFCETVFTTCTVGFPEDITELASPDPLDYTLCQNNEIIYTFHTSASDIYNLSFDLRWFDLTMQNVSVTFIYQESSLSSPLTLFTAAITTTNSTHSLQPISGVFDGIIKIGGTVYVVLNFTPVSTFTGSPFSLNYNFVSYCGANSPITSAVPFTGYNYGGANCAPSVSVLPSTTICSGSTVTFTANILNGTPGTITYDWQINSVSIPGQIPGGLPTCTTAVSSTDVISVLVSINGQTPILGTANINISSFSNCCYPSDFNNFTDIDLSGLSASQLPYSTYNTSSRIIINDRLIVDQDLTFSNCKHILMGPGAVIEVLAGITLTIGTSHISAVPDCNQMWSGIQVNTNGTLIVFEGEIEDAATAVNMQVNSNLQSSKSMRFLNNVIGINATLPSNPMGVNSIGFDVDDTYFESTRNLITAYPGQTILPLTRGFAGIRLNRISSLSIGAGISGKIHFRNLNFGIYSNQSNLIVDNCKFKDLLNFDPNYPRGQFSGTGIFCESKSTTNSLDQTGDNDNLDLDFDHCLNGIFGIQTSLRIHENKMHNLDIGIRSIHANYAKIYIERNQIDCNSVGISLLDNDRVASLDVLSNTIDAGIRTTNIRGGVSQTIGVDIADNGMNLTSAIKNIDDNRVNLFENGRIGLHLIAGVEYLISGNLVTMKNATRSGGGLVNMRGIQIDKSDKNTISCNNIVGESDLTIYEDNEAAMQIAESNENMITQNSVYWSSNGLRFIGNCISNGGNPTQNIQKNVFGPNFYGLHYNINSSVEGQDLAGNQWRIPPVGGQMNAKNDISNPASFAISQYHVAGSGFVNPIGVTPSWFYPYGGVDLSIDPSDCGLPPVGSPVPSDIAKLIDLIGDTINKSDFYKKLVWQYQIQLYDYLQKYPDLITQDPELADFYTIAAATNIAQIVDIKNSKNELLSEQSVLINNIKQRSIEICSKSLLLNEVTKSLKQGWAKDAAKDSLIELRNTLMSSLDYLVMINNSSVTSLNNSISGKVILLTGQNLTLEEIELYQKLEKDVNAILFKLLDGKTEDSLANDDVQRINYISELCPLIAGPAVYHARSIRKLFDPNVDYDDAFNCLQSGYIYRTGNYEMHSFSLYPNPNRGRFTLSYDIDKEGTFEIMDLLGRRCYSLTLNEFNNMIEVDLSSFNKGLYHYRIINSIGNSEFNGKLVIE